MSDHLKTTLGKAIPRSPAAVGFLVDGSGSIADNDFATHMKNALTKFDSLVQQHQRFLIQFSSDTRLECPATKDSKAFCQTVSDMKQMNSGTDAAAGFNRAFVEFNKPGVQSASEKLLVFFTDGHSSTDTTQAVNDLKALGVKIFCIGLGGGISPSALKKIAGSTECYVRLENYTVLFQVLQNFSVSQDGEVEVPVVLELKPASYDLESGKSLKLDLLILNNSEDDIPAGTKITFPVNNYFQGKFITLKETVESESEHETQIELRVKGGADPDDFPSTLSWKIQAKNKGKIYCQGTTTLSTGYLRGDFYYEKMPITVLLFGQMGSGKSAFVNSFINMLSTKKTSEPARVASLKTHVTKKMTKYVVNHYLKEPQSEKIPFVIYDLWGDSRQDYKNISVTHFINGWVSPGQDKFDDFDDLQSRSDYVHKHTKEYEMHVVVFVCTIAARKDAEHMKRMNNHITKVMQKCDRTPLLLVTHMDNIKNEEAKQEAIAEMIEAVPITKGNIYFQQNYTDKVRDAIIDFSTRKIASAIFQRGVEFHEHNPKGIDYYDECNWDLITKRKKVVKNEARTPPDSPRSVGSPAKGPTIMFTARYKGKTTKMKLKLSDPLSRVSRRMKAKGAVIFLDADECEYDDECTLDDVFDEDDVNPTLILKDA